jgi:hypothetical protein
MRDPCKVQGFTVYIEEEWQVLRFGQEQQSLPGQKIGRAGILPVQVGTGMLLVYGGNGKMPALLSASNN